MITVNVVRICTILFSILLLLTNFYHYSKRNLTDGTSMSWCVFGIVLLIGGIHPFLWGFASNIDSHIYIITAGIFFLLIMGNFTMSIKISRLRLRNQELAIMMAILREEKEDGKKDE